MSRNILLTLKYVGTAYHGWQLQENAVTVQQQVNKAINSVLHENINVNGCSRTDAGVHAEMFCCNFRSQTSIPCERLIGAVNAYLPADICVTDAKDVPFDFHARFSCKGKEYVYRIINTKRRDPFYADRAYFYPYYLDEKLLDEQARDLIGYHDFAAFCASGSSVSDTHRTVFSAGVERKGDVVEFRISGDGFLYNMVRIAAGTLLYIARGKIDAGAIPSIIASKDRTLAGITVPPQGLYLSKVFYEQEEADLE